MLTASVSAAVSNMKLKSTPRLPTFAIVPIAKHWQALPSALRFLLPADSAL